MKTTSKFSAILLALVLVVFACNKHEGAGKMTVKMKDNPIELDAVFVEVLRVEVHHSNANGGGWIPLETDAGIYNLLELQNGLTTTLSDSVELPVGKINQMRLILGSSNTVVVDSVTFPLLLSSQDETGLKFNLNTQINDGENVEVLFDFDAEKSIVLEGNGSYRLKPVIKVESIIYN